MSAIWASEFDGDPLVMSNKQAAEVLKQLQRNMNLNVGRGNGKSGTVFEVNLTFCKAIDFWRKHLIKEN